jgi:raffinose synthase
MDSYCQTLAFNQKEDGLSVISGGKERLQGGKVLLQQSNAGITLVKKIENNVALFSLSGTAIPIAENTVAGLFFKQIKDYKRGVTIWRYKPWNSWTKPIAVANATDMQPWDVQFFYWQYEDGTYGAALPMSNDTFRTTLGSEPNAWGSKAMTYAATRVNNVPALAVAFGTDPYGLVQRLYATALKEMGRAGNLQAKKQFPKPLEYIGWCTWNASANGSRLSEETVLQGVRSFTGKGFPLGWVLVDDGWFQHKDQQLQSLLPNPAKFPNGFKQLNASLKKMGIRYTGLWHAFNGYWNGIDPASSLGKQYSRDLFTWTQKASPDAENAPLRTYAFIKPQARALDLFYTSWYRYMKAQGFDFTKVDNQLVVERMAVKTYPIMQLSTALHQSLYKASEQVFGGALINCMDMTADAYLNFGKSAVARAVEDYFPYKEGETYNLQHGNAAAHVLQAVYNSFYFSQMAYPDFDMFQSHHPHALFHAISRTISNGPVYLTDVPGQQDFALLNKLVYKDGKAIRASTSLLPTEDCLFQVQEAKLFKAFSFAGTAGLLGLFHAADADSVTGWYKAGDVHGIKGKRFLLYSALKKEYRLANRADSFRFVLPRMGCELMYVIPFENGFAPIGLVEKLNAPATVLSTNVNGQTAAVQLYEGGVMEAYAEKKPAAIQVNGRDIPFTYKNQILRIKVPMHQKPTVTIRWSSGT